MEVGKQIKKYRTAMNLSQEELADKVFVTRQTISNWENSKNYPDLHSLILLSSLFQVSLDILIKGDIEKMKEELKSEDIQKFNKESRIFAVLLIGSIVLVAPLYIYLKWVGLVLWGIFYAVTIYYAFKIEKQKKVFDIQTYKEIVAFSEGMKLDEIEKAKEVGKRPYQKVILLIGSMIIGFLVMYMMCMILM